MRTERRHHRHRHALSKAGSDGRSEQDFATVLDRRLKRIEEMKAKVEAKPTQIEAKLNPMPRIADKRYRRM